MPRRKCHKNVKELKDVLVNCDDKIDAIEDQIRIFERHVELIEIRLESFMKVVDSVKDIICAEDPEDLIIENSSI